VADAKRRKIFAFVPRSEAGNRSIAFVLPYFFSNSEDLSMRESDRVERLRQKDEKRGKNQRGQKVAAFGSRADLCS
jgi:hypothetical protein